MSEQVRGTGELWHEGKFLCEADYALDLPPAASEEASPRFTKTDGFIQIKPPAADDPSVIQYMEPEEELLLVLEEPLADGRERLPLEVEPYRGHDPRGRYQVQISER